MRFISILHQSWEEADPRAACQRYGVGDTLAQNIKADEANSLNMIRSDVLLISLQPDAEQQRCDLRNQNVKDVKNLYFSI